MKYEIWFNALNIHGVIVGQGAFCITTTAPLDITGKNLSFKRMCVEYARLVGIRCSDVEITDLDKRLVGTKGRMINYETK